MSFDLASWSDQRLKILPKGALPERDETLSAQMEKLAVSVASLEHDKETIEAKLRNLVHNGGQSKLRLSNQ